MVKTKQEQKECENLIETAIFFVHIKRKKHTVCMCESEKESENVPYICKYLEAVVLVVRELFVFVYYISNWNFSAEIPTAINSKEIAYR